jgi:hypothetical protein
MSGVQRSGGLGHLARVERVRRGDHRHRRVGNVRLDQHRRVGRIA